MASLLNSKIFEFLRPKKKIDNGCLYSKNTDAICNHLANIVTDRDNRMLAQFTEQNKLIKQHNEDMAKLLKRQNNIIKNDLRDKEKRLIAVEQYVKPQNMVFFDAMLRYKKVFIF